MAILYMPCRNWSRQFTVLLMFISMCNKPLLFFISKGFVTELSILEKEICDINYSQNVLFILGSYYISSASHPQYLLLLLLLCITNTHTPSFPSENIQGSKRNQIERLQERAAQELRHHVEDTYPDTPERFSRLLLKLPPLRALQPQVPKR